VSPQQFDHGDDALFIIVNKSTDNAKPHLIC